jgi:hypothetical protein
VIAQVEQLVQGETFFAYKVELYVDLEPLSALLQVGKTGLALQPDRNNAPCNFYRDTRIFQLLGCLLAVAGQNLRHGVGKGELVRIGLLAQGFNIAQLLLPQLVNAIFKGHCMAEPRRCKPVDYK